MSEKILILGGTRFIGPALIERLPPAEITCFHRGLHPFPDFQRPVRFFYGDRRSPEAIRQLAGEHYDRIIDLSGTAEEMLAVSIPMLAGSCGRYVYISSSSVYDRALPIPHREEEPLRTGGPDAYVRAKILGEALVREHCRNYTILRPSKVYGPGNYYFRESDYLEQLRRSPVVDLINDPVLHFTYIDDLADGIAALSDCDGIYNTAGCECANLSRFIRLIGRLHGISCTFRRSGTSDVRFSELLDCTLDLTRAREAGGWQPRVPLEEGLRRTFALPAS